jgi:hypothetical protein
LNTDATDKVVLVDFYAEYADDDHKGNKIVDFGASKLVPTV